MPYRHPLNIMSYPPPVAPRLHTVCFLTFVALFTLAALAVLGGHVLSALYPAIP